uniref:RRM domain-containing protein n=1 Tax=Timema douglasi TaxID=61478 RepID=A0A7R8VKX0_TIMDO|nr:unnamed protein product [Timema douglasi]
MTSTTEDLHDKRSLMSSPDNSINGTNVAHIHTTTLEPRAEAEAVAVAVDHISQDKLGSPVYISCDNSYGAANVGSTPSQLVHGVIPNQNSEFSSVEWNQVQNDLPTYGHQEEHKQDFHAPKYGTLITNRIFIGALPITATENDLLELFSGFGIVTSAKIITDRAGISKGYGFVTFMNDTDAAYVLSTFQSNSATIRGQKINVAHAIRKQSYVHTSNCSTLVPMGTVVYRKRKVISPLSMSNQPYYQQVLATQPQQNPMPLVDGTSLLPYLGMNVSSSPSTPPSPSMVPVLYSYPVPQGQPWIVPNTTNLLQTTVEGRTSASSRIEDHVDHEVGGVCFTATLDRMTHFDDKYKVETVGSTAAMDRTTNVN